MGLNQMKMAFSSCLYHIPHGFVEVATVSIRGSSCETDQVSTSQISHSHAPYPSRVSISPRPVFTASRTLPGLEILSSTRVCVPKFPPTSSPQLSCWFLFCLCSSLLAALLPLSSVPLSRLCEPSSSCLLRI